jgi:hypothetical protein
MRCINCSAELGSEATECEFCGEKVKPLAPPAPNKAVFTASEPTYTQPKIPEPKASNPYSDPYPESQKSTYKTQRFTDVPNYLIWAILSTLCCCVPTGIVAIIHAAQVNSKLANGDYHGAQESSDNAKMWNLISFGLGIVVIIISVLIRQPGDYPN